METESVDYLNSPIVIDNGSGLIKAGFGGDDSPKTIIHSLIGIPKYTKVMIGADYKDTYIGAEAQEFRLLLSLQNPIEHGIVTDWSSMEKIWHHTIYNELHVRSPEDLPVLITEAPLNPTSNREKMAQVFFETFNSPAVYVAVQSVLSLYSQGRTQGLAVDCGDGVMHVVPVIKGFSLTSAIMRSDLAGRDVTDHLAFLLRRDGHVFESSSEKQLVRIIKEKMCRVSLNPAKDESMAIIGYNTNTRAEEVTSTNITIAASRNTNDANLSSIDDKSLDTRINSQNSSFTSGSFKLPDGNIVVLGTTAFRAPEILFKPEIIGKECLGVQDLILQSVRKLDIESRGPMLQEVILSGGTTFFKGFGERLVSELKKGSGNGNNKIKIYAAPERKFSVWIGGSILSSLSSFRQLWVSNAEYQENPRIVHQKCF